MAYREHEAPGIPSTPARACYYGAATTEAPALAAASASWSSAAATRPGRAPCTCRALRAGGADRRPRELAAQTMSQYLVEQIARHAEHPRAPAHRGRSRRRRPATSSASRCRAVDDTMRRARPWTRCSCSSARGPAASGCRPTCCAMPKGFVLSPAGTCGRTRRSRGPGRTREPLCSRPSVPGVFAAGDVRAGAMNRVASAVGEGSMVNVRSCTTPGPRPEASQPGSSTRLARRVGASRPGAATGRSRGSRRDRASARDGGIAVSCRNLSVEIGSPSSKVMSIPAASPARAAVSGLTVHLDRGTAGALRVRAVDNALAVEVAISPAPSPGG